MRAIAYLAAFELSGLLIAFCLGGRRRAAIKIWLGLVIGLMELMWLPSLFAFALRFDIAAHRAALTCALLAGAVCGFFILKNRRARQKPTGSLPPVWLMLALLIPLCALEAYMHYTHTFREIEGALYVGQSTYGDLCMHAGFVTGLIGQEFPPEYTILPGTRLGYPFLVDALSSSLYLYGLPLNLAIVIPGALMTALIFWGFALFSWELTRSKAATALALICLVFSGGLGFLYYYDLNGALNLDTLSYRAAPLSTLEQALGGYYHAPANYPDLNLRWVNALCDLLIPQRTLMAGWMCLIPALYLLYTAIKTGKRRNFILLGCFAGPMVMIHTHSFLGLGAISLGAMIDCAFRQRERRRELMCGFMLYGGIAVLLALPQLLLWTFPQTFEGGSLRFLFNWVNNRGADIAQENGVFRDSYLWFWIKNVGPMFLILPFAAISSRKKGIKALALGSLLTFLLAETVVFQPNVYDNNKLFWTAYLCMLPVGCGYIVRLIAEHKSYLARGAISLVLIVLLTASGALSIAREVISGLKPLEVSYAAQSEPAQEETGSLYSASAVAGTLKSLTDQSEKERAYQIFSQSQVKAAEFIRENTFTDALFLTANNHNNAVAVLTGRRIVCGPGLYLYYHGVDYMQQEADARLMLVNPVKYQDLFESYGVDYVFLSNYELNEMRNNGADMEAFAALYPLIYQSDEEYWYDTVRIYAVSERARVKFQEDNAKGLQ